MIALVGVLSGGGQGGQELGRTGGRRGWEVGEQGMGSLKPGF